MKILNFRKNKKEALKIEDYKQYLLIRQCREQFRKLLEKGLSVPVVLL
jgi:hypothetical protein